MPTVGSRVSIARKRRLVTKKILNRVSRYERHVPAQSETSDVLSDISSESSADDRTQLLWVQLKEKRQRLDEMKQDMAARRKQLRQLRRRKDEADNLFMGLLRPLFVNGRGGVHGTPVELLNKRFDDMQRLRFEYHFMESAYEGLEIALDEQNEELNKLEVRFFSLLVTGRNRSSRVQTRSSETADQRPSKAQSNVPYLLLGISPEGPPLDDIHPLWRRLVSAIGDLNLAQEELDDLLLHRDEVVHNLEMKNNTGQLPTEEEEGFMAAFPEEERKRRQKAEGAAKEIPRLRQLCKDHGVEMKHPPFDVAYALDRDIGQDLTLHDAWSESESLAHPRFPELLSQPDHVFRSPEPLTIFGDLKQAATLPANDPSKKLRMHIAIKEYDIHDLVHGFRGGNSFDFVTRWLLYQLRTNPLEVHLLSNTFLDQTALKILDLRRWTRDVLYHWWRDGTALDMTDPADEPSADSSMRGHNRSSWASRAASENRCIGRLGFVLDKDDSKSAS